MMINEQEMRAIAFVAARCRPTGAKPWDEAGIVANLRRVASLNLAEVTIAAIRAAANRQADSPGVIPVTTGEHWREKVAERGPYRPPKRDEICRRPGHVAYPAANCPGCATEGREQEPEPSETAPVAIDPSLRGVEAARAALAATRSTNPDPTEAPHA